MIRFKISGWGNYLPRLSVTSAQLDTKHGHPEGWTRRNFGIECRHVAGPDETSSMMGTAACQQALARAGWEPASLNVIIGGCGVMEQPIPSTAVLVQEKLGLGRSGIPAFDVNQTCLSFMTALDVASMGMATGRWTRAMLFSSDIASAGLDPQNPKTRSIFGDGAAAIAIEAAPDYEGGLLSAVFRTYGYGHSLAQLRSGGTKLRIEEGYDALTSGSYFEMDAFGIFKAAARSLPDVINEALTKAKCTKEDLDLIICHQASAPGVEHVRRLFAPASDRVVNIFSDHGNQIAASIPTVLAYALTKGLAKKGQKVLLLGTAAGISAGAMVLKL